MSCEQELKTLHKVYFEDISISEWKRRHDKSDGIAENSREWHRLGVASTSIVGIGAGAYSYSSSKKITIKNINDLPYNVQDSYTKYSNYSTKKGKSPWNNNATPHGSATRSGKKYLNDDGLLPSGNYIEYDVNGTTKPNKRDGERFVKNDETGEVYYTNNHYENFIKIIE